MATQTPKAAPAPAPEPLAALHPPVTAFQTVWVHHTDVAAVQGRVGWVQLLRAEAQALIAAGDASDPYSGQPLQHIGPAPAPAPTPAPSPAPTPAPSPAQAPTPAPSPTPEGDGGTVI